MILAMDLWVKLDKFWRFFFWFFFKGYTCHFKSEAFASFASIALRTCIKYRHTLHEEYWVICVKTWKILLVKNWERTNCVRMLITRTRSKSSSTVHLKTRLLNALTGMFSFCFKSGNVLTNSNSVRLHIH